MLRTIVATSLLSALSFLSAGAAWAGAGLIVADPSVDAYRSADGSLTVTVQASNPTKGMSIAALNVGSCRAVGAPVLEPKSTADVHFSFDDCPTELGTVEGELEATLVSDSGQQSPGAAVPLTLTVKRLQTTDWSALRWFLTGFAALFAVLPPYLTWLAFPLGNQDRRARFHWADGWAIIRMLWSRDLIDHLDWDLPGISSDWSFKDNWASNVGLGASVFTGVFAAADPLRALVGDGAEATLAIVAVASAMAAALIATGPLWLAILKRRTKQNQGYARHNMVCGVLLASFVVYFATIGLVATVVHVTGALVPGPLVTLLGAGALLLLVLYAWKTIPQTLGLGRIETGLEAWVVEQPPFDEGLVVRPVRLAPAPTPEGAEEAPPQVSPEIRILPATPVRVSAMP